MKFTPNRRQVLELGLAMTATLALPRVAHASLVHDVEMYTRHPENKKLRNVFLPRLLVVDPGDQVRFIPSEKGHDSAAHKKMVPDGVEPWKGRINKEITVTFEKPGYYGYICQPHYPLGMVGMVVVRGEGMNNNLEAARSVKHRGKAKLVFAEIWHEVDRLGLTSAPATG